MLPSSELLLPWLCALVSFLKQVASDMDTSQQDMRAEFEDKFPLPNGVTFSSELSAYVQTKPHTRKMAHTYNCMYVSYIRCWAYRQQEIDRLRGALDKIAWLRHPSEKCSAHVEKLEKIALAALAAPKGAI